MQECVRPCLHARVCARVFVCVRLRGCVGVCLCACVRVLRARVLMCVHLCVCACEDARVAVLLGGALGMLGWYLRDTKGTRRVLECTRGVLKRHSRGTQGVLKLMGCTLGYLGGAPRNLRVRACVAVHRLS